MAKNNSWAKKRVPSLIYHLEQIMSDALIKHGDKVTIAGRNVSNLRFADGTDALSEKSRNGSPS